MPKPLLIVLLFFSSFAAVAGPATYTFCIRAEGFESFRAVVTFRAVDFGESTARQLVMNEVRAALGESTKINISRQAVCPCDNNCQTLKFTPTEWAGKMGDNFEEGGFKTIPSSSAAAIDHLVYEAQSLLRIPGILSEETFLEISSLNGSVVVFTAALSEGSIDECRVEKWGKDVAEG